MKTKEIALRLYVLSCILAVLATIIDNELLILLVKPAVIPSILYYYLASKKHPVNWVFISVLLLNFVGDTMVLLGMEGETETIMIPYFISYLLLLGFAIQDVRKIRLVRQGILVSVLLFCFLMYVLYELVQMFIDTNAELVAPVTVYGVVLGVFGCITAYCYYARSAAFTFYMVMFALTSIVSDVFYMMFNFLFHIGFLNYIEFGSQLFSYYFLVKYFVLRKK